MDLNKKLYYENRAIHWAEKYGIITYKIKGYFMIYNRNSKNTQFIGGKWVSKPVTYQHTVNLITMEEEPVKTLKRLQKDGWNNAL